MAQLNESVGADVPTPGRGPGQDPGPLRQGQGHRRAERDVGRRRGCSRSSRPPPTSRPRAASASCAPSSVSAAAPPRPSRQPVEQPPRRPRRPESRLADRSTLGRRCRELEAGGGPSRRARRPAGMAERRFAASARAAPSEQIAARRSRTASDDVGDRTRFRAASTDRASPSRADADSGRQQDQVVAVDDLVGHAGREVAGVAAGDAAQLGGLDEHHAAGERDAVGAGDVDGVALAEAARRRRRRRPGSRLVWRSTSARRAPSSTVTVPATWEAKAIHSLRAGSLRRWASNVVPTGSSAIAPASTAGRPALAMTVRTPDHEAIRAASSLRRHAAAPPPAAAAAGADGEQRVVAAHRRHELGVGVRRAGRRCTGRRGR